MQKLISWIILAVVVYLMWQAGVFQGIVNYFVDSYNKSRQEQVIYQEDGTVTTVKYRSIFDMFMGK